MQTSKYLAVFAVL